MGWNGMGMEWNGMGWGLLLLLILLLLIRLLLLLVLLQLALLLLRLLLLSGPHHAATCDSVRESAAAPTLDIAVSHAEQRPAFPPRRRLARAGGAPGLRRWRSGTGLGAGSSTRDDTGLWPLGTGLPGLAVGRGEDIVTDGSPLAGIGSWQSRARPLAGIGSLYTPGIGLEPKWLRSS